MGCRFMTSYHGVADRGEVSGGDWVVVNGCGGIGLSAVQVAASLGAQVIAVDLEEGKLSLARSQGAVETINALESDVPMRVREITDGGADVSVDALGIKATMLNSVNSLRKGGVHVQIGITSADEAGEVGLPDRLHHHVRDRVPGLPRPAQPELPLDAQHGRLRQALKTRDHRLRDDLVCDQFPT